MRGGFAPVFRAGHGQIDPAQGHKLKSDFFPIALLRTWPDLHGATGYPDPHHPMDKC